ncbi:MAG TPA: hypothetical protein PK011_17465, partial [Marinagarivorans sp.]|nr:hypothetical protein [Marinagarivorans sp.]
AALMAITPPKPTFKVVSIKIQAASTFITKSSIGQNNDEDGFLLAILQRALQFHSIVLNEKMIGSDETAFKEANKAECPSRP